jgi:hypothetical protein
MKMTARWRKEPNEQGLARVCQRPRGFELRENGEVLIHVSAATAGGWSREVEGWYWYGMGQNTCREPVATADEAKEQATKFYKENKP